MSSIFTEFGIILGVATAMALIMRLLRQPLIIGHIITGVLVGPLFWNILRSDEIFLVFSEMGIAFLLFTVGLNLNPHVLKDYGKVSLITGFGQVIITALAGFAISSLLGFNTITSLYIGIALAFSSTIIILKLISDKGDLDKLYAKISIGFLLVQDLIVFTLLFSLPFISGSGGISTDFLSILVRAVIFIGAVIAVAKIVVARMHPYLSRSTELLFLFSTAWGLGIAVLSRELGFPLETGALVAGVALALLPTRHEVAARLSPLRDFFIIIFFVLLGAQIDLANVGSMVTPAIAFSLLVLVGNPIILMAIMGLLGYRKKTSLQTGFTVAQISEFSLIFLGLGVTLGHVDQSILSLATLVGIVTIFGSTYLILYSDFWYKKLRPFIGVFERKRVIEKKEIKNNHEIIIFGTGRVGFEFVEMFKDRGEKLLVVDHDPEAIRRLEGEGVYCHFGDAGDPEFLDSIEMSKVEIVISTVPDLNTNLLILNRVKSTGDIPVLVVSHSITNALKLYQYGASYVILPHFLGASYASTLAKRIAEKGEDLAGIRDKHIINLKQRFALGHEHPVIEKYR